MAKKIFLIGIGGTGMRCLESFVHTCAMGMYDETEVEMLALDTDKDNGNFVRLRDLVNQYNTINGGSVKKDTFFSARINYYEFSPGYQSGDSFAKIADYGTMSSYRNTVDNNHKKVDYSADFVDLFIDSKVREMDLLHGYRAQTQMGSLLMYYAIERAAYNNNPVLRSFLTTLNNAMHCPVFVFGSVFGGTGASSIPILPLAFDRANRIYFDRDSALTRNNYFGSIVLTSYFRFDISSTQLVAKSDNFAINSQSALMFYRENPTVKDTYKRLYLLGRSKNQDRDVVDAKTGGSKAVTGGIEQTNPADYIELIAAFAAYDFIKEATQVEPFKEQGENRFFCLAHDYGTTNKLGFDVFAQADANLFKEKIGALTVASLLDLKGTEFFASMANQRNMFETFNSDDARFKALHKYFALYNIGLDANDNIVDGWLRKMNLGRGGQGILFNDNLFNCKTLKDVKKYKYNKELFYGDNPEKFNVGVFSSIFDEVKSRFIATDVDKKTSFDDLISRTYSTINTLYFNK